MKIVLSILAVLVMGGPTAADEAERAVNAALAAAEPAVEDWEACLFTFVTRVAKHNAEPAELIAKAALSICVRHDNLVFEAMANASRYPWWRNFVATDMHPAIRQSVHEKTLAAVMAARSSR